MLERSPSFLLRRKSYLYDTQPDSPRPSHKVPSHRKTSLEAVEDCTATPVAVLGEAGVGKTALIVRCLTKRFLPEYAASSEEYYRYSELSSGQDVVIIDSDARNDDIISSSEGFILVYSVTSAASFNTVRTLLGRIAKLNQKKPCLTIVANKTDLRENRVVTVFEGMMLAKHFDAKYFELSVACEVEPVIKVFKDLWSRMTHCDELSISLDESSLNKRKTGLLTSLFRRRGST